MCWALTGRLSRACCSSCLLSLALLSERQAQICGSACPHKADGYQQRWQCGLPHAHAFETIAPYLECQTVRLELSSHGPVPTRFFYYRALARSRALLGRTSIRSCCCERASADVRLCLCVRRSTFALPRMPFASSWIFSCPLALSIRFLVKLCATSQNYSF